jgi:hypothetical protein
MRGIYEIRNYLSSRRGETPQHHDTPHVGETTVDGPTAVLLLQVRAQQTNNDRPMDRKNNVHNVIDRTTLGVNIFRVSVL